MFDRISLWRCVPTFFKVPVPLLGRLADILISRQDILRVLSLFLDKFNMIVCALLLYYSALSGLERDYASTVYRMNGLNGTLNNLYIRIYIPTNKSEYCKTFRISVACNIQIQNLLRFENTTAVVHQNW